MKTSLNKYDIISEKYDIISENSNSDRFCVILRHFHHLQRILSFLCRFVRREHLQRVQQLNTLPSYLPLVVETWVLEAMKIFSNLRKQLRLKTDDHRAYFFTSSKVVGGYSVWNYTIVSLVLMLVYKCNLSLNIRPKQ